MLGKRSPQRGRFEADPLYRDFVGRDSFYGFLAEQRGRLFSDEEFAALDVLDNGRPCVPPSLLATALLLQTHDRASDEEATGRAAFDLRWKVALGIGLDERPFEKLQAILARSLDVARQAGHFKGGKIRVALDTSPILGRGAVKDTSNLLADGIVKLVRMPARLDRADPAAWADERGLGRYLGTSLKGEAGIDWEDPPARQRLLSEIVADADRLPGIARAVLADLAPDAAERATVTEATRLLGQILLQDVERTGDGARIAEGVAQDRLLSVHDPEMRHGRKSATKRFDGHKAAIAVDPESQLITAVTVLAGNVPDCEQAQGLVEQSEANARVEVVEAIGDCAYGDGATRRAFADAGRTLIAKVPPRPNGACFTKEDFAIDVGAHTCAGVVTLGSHRDRRGALGVVRGFAFPAGVCAACPLRPRCVKAGPAKGRTVSLHPQEALLPEARAFQRSEGFAPHRRLRQAAEPRIARLMQLGMRQARYFGRAKARGQLILAAAVANLTLVARPIAPMPHRPRAYDHLALVASAWLLVALAALDAIGANALTFDHGPRDLRAGCRPRS